jgi:hypothetical protein
VRGPTFFGVEAFRLEFGHSLIELGGISQVWAI